MASSILTPTPNNTTATGNNGELNVERLAEALTDIIGKRITSESLETLILDAVGAIGYRLRSVETESDDHEARLKRLETAMKFLHPKQVSTGSEDEDFEVLSHVANVKATIEKSGLRGMDPDAADAIWRSVDGIQQLIDPVVAVRAV